MTRKCTHLVLRANRAKLNAYADLDDLNECEPYFITDDRVFAVGVSDNSFIETVRNDGGVKAIKVCTQAEYDALTPDATTIYIIAG
jgi:hypothetical protein